MPESRITLLHLRGKLEILNSLTLRTHLFLAPSLLPNRQLATKHHDQEHRVHAVHHLILNIFHQQKLEFKLTFPEKMSVLRALSFVDPLFCCWGANLLPTEAQGNCFLTWMLLTLDPWKPVVILMDLTSLKWEHFALRRPKRPPTKRKVESEPTNLQCFKVLYYVSKNSGRVSGQWKKVTLHATPRK